MPDWPTLAGYLFAFGWIAFKAATVFSIEHATTFVIGGLWGFLVGVGLFVIHGRDR